MRTKSRITGEIYDTNSMVFIVNTLQAGKYIKNNANLIDCFWSRDSLVFVFEKNDTKELYQLWQEHNLN